MSRYYAREWDDDYDARGRPQRRDYSPDYYPSSRPYDHGPYVSGGNQAGDRHLNYDRPLSPPQQDNSALQVPSSHTRPRSLPPPQHALIPRSPSHYARSTSRSPPCYPDDHDHERSRRRSPSRGPIDQVRSAVDKTFSTSASGLGVSLLGALVGGMAAREMSSAAALRSRSKKELNDAMNGLHADDREGGPVYNPPHPRARRSSSASKKDADNSRLVSTVVGAVVGGLGANAIERHFENSRQRHREEQEAWERKWGHREGHDDREKVQKSGEARHFAGRRDEHWDAEDRSYNDSRRRSKRTGSEDGQYR